MTLFSVNRDIPARTSLLPCPVTPSLKPKPEPKPEPEAEPKPEPKAKPEPEAEPVLCIPTQTVQMYPQGASTRSGLSKDCPSQPGKRGRSADQVNPLLPCLAGWRS